MNYKGDGGYEVVYPQVQAENVINFQLDNDILSQETKGILGLDSDATPTEAFRTLYMQNVLQDKCFFKLTVNVAGKPLQGLFIKSTSFVDANGNPVAGPLTTDNNGVINTYFKTGNITLSINSYGDIVDYSQSYGVLNGEKYEYTWNLTTRNFVKYTTSGSVMFSNNVSRIDVTCVGGGAGGAGVNNTKDEAGSGGGGGYCIVQEQVPFNKHQLYSFTVGSGGASGFHLSNPPGGKSSFLNIKANGAEGQTGNGKGGNGDAWGVGYSGTSGSVAGYTSFTNTTVYGGGGGGGGRTEGGPGAGYGGNGGAIQGNGTNGISGFGGGGGGGGRADSVGGEGGSGCVAIRMHLKFT